MLEAMAEPVSAILDVVCSVIERTPPELLGDILKYGIIMTGGGSMVHGFDKLINKVTGVPVRVAEDPVSCVVKGTGIALRNYKQLPEGTINLARARRDRL
jgi:rod shape-determining protein MreB